MFGIKRLNFSTSQVRVIDKTDWITCDQSPMSRLFHGAAENASGVNDRSRADSEP
jgi:hypothetical protein